MAKRVFISFAVEDAWARDFLVGQARLKESPFEFVDMSVKEPWDSSWKTRCRTKIKGCDGVIALLSRNTMKADGALWEMKCADEEGVPMMGMHISKTDRGAVPAALIGHTVTDWGWDELAEFIDSL